MTILDKETAIMVRVFTYLPFIWNTANRG